MRPRSRQAKAEELLAPFLPREICAAVKSQYNETIDKKKVHLEEPIRAQGTYEVKVKLHPQVTAVMRVHVSGE